MSFSSDLKMELSQINNLKNKQEVYAEFLGYLASKNIDVKGKNVKFSTESEYNINRFAKLLNNLEIKDYKINITGKTYSITYKCNRVPTLIDAKNFLHVNLGQEKNQQEGLQLAGAKQEKSQKAGVQQDVLKQEGLMQAGEKTDFLKQKDVKQEQFKQDNLKKAYIRGNFLGAGSINNPKNKYHMEIIFKDSKYAEFSLKLINEYSIGAKILDKTVYLKDGEEISKMLALIGGHGAVLKFEEIRVLREMKNNVNRIVNCETANLNKTINAAVKQAELIKKLKKTGKFNNLPEDLKEIANLREENPEATLEQLGAMLKNPIGKSSVSHRFKKIEEYL